MHESDFCVGVLKRSMYFSISTYDFEYLHEIDFADDKEGKGSKISIQSRINKMNEKWKERFNKRSCLFMKIDQIHKVNLDMVYFTLVNLRNGFLYEKLQDQYIFGIILYHQSA